MSDTNSPQSLLAQLYSQLRAAAQQQMANERHNHTLSATALVHEAWLRLSPPRDVPFANRAHFYAAAVEAMRQILLDHSRTRGRKKRGGGQQPINLDTPLDLGSDENMDDYLNIDEAIQRLEKHDPRMAKVVQLRFFAGLSVAETAALLGVSERTIKGDWAFARAWLARSLDKGG
ncbi:MAG: sigma-70 family RNA polymerase sigma factor [Planctomycetes bacterium]|jgi:RNA polymerase sigma factor (TIGR02999 family)|nr:sigma-70 family RNA polymerase sigma factor [Planctomycetota bacterium]